MTASKLRDKNQRWSCHRQGRPVTAMSFVHTALRLFTHIDQRQFLEEVVGTAPEQQRPPPASTSPPLHPGDDKNYGHKQRDSGHINCTLLKLNFHAINYLPTHYPAKRERGPAGGSWGLGVGDAEERWRCHFMVSAAPCVRCPFFFKIGCWVREPCSSPRENGGEWKHLVPTFPPFVREQRRGSH